MNIKTMKDLMDIINKIPQPEPDKDGNIIIKSNGVDPFIMEDGPNV